MQTTASLESGLHGRVTLSTFGPMAIGLDMKLADRKFDALEMGVRIGGKLLSKDWRA